tara:strand:- start:17205 stop:17927 length:723 start_codon:yes stop_codon:yes gene_type:complete
MANEWFYAACAKMQVNNSEPFILSFEDTAFRDMAEQIPNVDFNDLCIFALISPFFTPNVTNMDQNWSARLPRLNFTAIPEDMVMLGRQVNSLSNPYPENRTGLVCFTKESFKALMMQEPPTTDMTPQEWQDLVISTPFDELQSLLETFGSSPFKINGTRSTLRIMPCSREEIKSLDPYGGLDAPRVDIFNLVKERLTNTVKQLDDKGLEPAKYYAGGNYIEFVAECSISISETMPTNPQL